jgi:hypothetical protein
MSRDGNPFKFTRSTKNASRRLWAKTQKLSFTCCAANAGNEPKLKDAAALINVGIEVVAGPIFAQLIRLAVR